MNNENRKMNSKMVIVSLLSFVCFLPACKPSTQSTLSANSGTSNEEIFSAGKMIDDGLDLLAQDTQEPWDESSINTALSLNAGPSRRGNPFATVIQNVSTRWQSLQKNPCAVWKNFLTSTHTGLMHPYFFVGGSAEAGVGIHGVIGRDFVWDFYNLQFSSFNYKAVEAVMGSGTAGAGANTYLGLGLGWRKDVIAAWSGRFSSTGISGSLPILSDYLSLHANAFTALDNKGRVDSSFFGATIGLSFALSVPTPIPGAIQVSNGFWTPDLKINNEIAQKLSRMKIPHANQGNDTCQGKCIRFDNSSKGKGYTGRAVNLARSISAVMSLGPQTPYPSQLERIVLLALAVGAYRDTLNAANLCRR